MTPYVAMAAGAYLSAGAFWLNGHNARSTLLICVIPGLIGFVLLAWGLFASGLLL